MYVKNMLKSSILSSMDQKVIYFYLREVTVKGVTANGVSLTVSETHVHLGQHMSTKDKKCTVNAAKIVFGDLLICSYLIMVIYILFLKINYLDNIAVVNMGHLCGHCKVMELSLSVFHGERHWE